MIMQIQLQMENKLLQTLRVEQIQSLEILQLSSIELEQYLNEKVSENPLLTMDDTYKMLDIYVEKERFPASFSLEGEQVDFFERHAMEKLDYEKYLLEQVPFTVPLTKVDLNILKFLIGSLDDRLFLDIELEEVAQIFHTTKSHVQRLVELLQSFEPVGVGARNYKEYLFLQINRLPDAPPIVKEMIKNDLHLVAEKKLRQLAKKYNEPLSVIEQAIEWIKQLNPIQTGYKETAIPYIVPDIEVIRVEGQWVIQLIRKNLPTVQINEEYVELLKQQSGNEEFLKRHLRDANAILLGIEKRNKTIYEFVRLLLEIQPEFFEQGKAGLKPMGLKEIAEKLNVHISTISRAVKGKYLQTQHGIFSFQSLFTKGIVSPSGKVNSIDFIKNRIKELIEQENRSKPLTDAQIANELKNEGIQISRRTVAKYRIEMNIASSYNRAL